MNKINAAIRELEKVPFVLVNFKGTDAAGHDGLPVLKRSVIERMDRSLSPLIESGITVCITGDHSTPCELKEHSGDPLPILFNSPGSRRDGSSFFDEISCAKSSIRIDSGSVLQFMKQLSGNDEKYGA
jgi:2,3-bisphosphoglycerate-independent phosphoglycerate mutase